MPQDAANKQNETISVKQIEIEKYGGAEEDTINFNHRFTIEFKDMKGITVDEVDMNGQMTVVKTADSLKIARYYDSHIPLEKLSP
ncbi:hypothetical protein SPD48_18485 [Pseudogracilibacillus sp. SE30717A]|uniref:hypothetical protein n=1 Tax=Pseudogracilibacillus sp. SE30717A TaxID=3098293 RepID=UPI00300DE89F